MPNASSPKPARKKKWVVLIVVAAVAVIGTVVVVVAPWKDPLAVLPYSIGTLSRDVTRSAPMEWMGSENAVWSVLPSSGSQYWHFYPEELGDARPVYLMASAVKISDPAGTVAQVLSVLQAPNLRWGLELVDITRVETGGRWLAAQCGEGTILFYPLDGSSRGVGPEKVVGCAWASDRVAGVALFLNRDRANSEDWLAGISEAVTVIRN